MATESVDDIIWAAKERDISVDEAKQRLDAYYTRECARKVLEARIDELANIYIARTVPKKSFQLFSMKLTPWPKLEDRLKQLEAELRAAIAEPNGEKTA